MSGIKRELLAAREACRRLTTLGALAEQSIDVFCWCNRCGHNAVLETPALVAQLGPLTPVPEVGARLRCSGCGGKDVATRPAWRGLGQAARHG